jgi:rRNA maturation endonuclease Nob1
MYVVIICYGCGRFLLAKAAQKTKTCPYCAAQLKLVKAKKVAHLKTAQEASHYIRALKRESSR